MTSTLGKGGPPRRSKPPPVKPPAAKTTAAKPQSVGVQASRPMGGGKAASLLGSSPRSNGAWLGGWAVGRAFRTAALTGLVGLALSVGVVFGAGYLAGSRQVDAPTEAAIQDAPARPAPSEPLGVQARRFERAIAALSYEEPQPGIAVPGIIEETDAEIAPEAVAALTAGPPVESNLRVAGPETSVAQSPGTGLEIPVEMATPDPPPWLAYAVPGPPASDRAPMIAIVIDDMGLDQPRSRRALDLPGPLTVAFLPYGYHLRDLASAARDRGHEVLVHLPMEPTGPGIDPGPNALLTTLTLEEIRARMNWAFDQFGGYVGFNNHMGSRFTAWEDGMRVVMDVARERGLLFLDSVTTVDSVAARLAAARSVPFVARDVFLDHDQAPEVIAAQLARVEAMARQRGQAIAIGHPHDTTLAALSAWLPTLTEKGFRLVPISTLALRSGTTVAGGQG